MSARASKPSKSRWLSSSRYPTGIAGSDGALAAEEALHVAAVLPQEARRRVLRVALDEHEGAPAAVFHGHGPVHLGRLDQVGVAVRLQEARGQVVEARVRHVNLRAKTFGERVAREDVLHEDPRALGRERLALDAVEQQGGGVRREAGDYGGGSRCLRPIR